MWSLRIEAARAIQHKLLKIQVIIRNTSAGG